MENGSHFLPSMENCHYFSGDAAPSNNSATSHSNASNSQMLSSLNASHGAAIDEPSNNSAIRHVNVISAISELESGRWNGSLLPVQTQQLPTGSSAMSASAHANGRIPSAHSTLAAASISPLPPQSQALWNAFHNSRNPWHFNGIPNCYQRLYNPNAVTAPPANAASAAAHNHYPYYHHPADHVDHRAGPVYAQNPQGLCLFYFKRTRRIDGRIG